MACDVAKPCTVPKVVSTSMDESMLRERRWSRESFGLRRSEFEGRLSYTSDEKGEGRAGAKTKRNASEVGREPRCPRCSYLDNTLRGAVEVRGARNEKEDAEKSDASEVSKTREGFCTCHVGLEHETRHARSNPCLSGVLHLWSLSGLGTGRRGVQSDWGS